MSTTPSKLAYHLKGSLTAPWILFFHGFLGSQHSWDSVIPHLSNYCCCAIDLPGHGGSKEVRLSQTETLKEVYSLLKVHKVEQCALIGYSMGGCFAQLFTHTYSSLVRLLILESTSPGIQDRREREERFTKDQERAQRMRSSSLKAFIKEWYAQPLFSTLHDYLWSAEYFRSCESSDLEGLSWALEHWSVGKQNSFWDRPIASNGALIVGEKDRKYHRIAHLMALYLPHFSLHIIPKSGHNSHLENTHDFVMTLKHILKVSYDLE